MPAEPIHVTDAEFQSKVLASAVPVVVDFWAQWCGPCKMMAPVFEKLAGQFEGKVTFAKVDVDENQQYAGQFGIRGIPTLVVFDGGKEVNRIVGFAPESQIRAKLEATLGPQA